LLPLQQRGFGQLVDAASASCLATGFEISHGETLKIGLIKLNCRLRIQSDLDQLADDFVVVSGVFLDECLLLLV
jgi:hypothetical protein